MGVTDDGKITQSLRVTNVHVHRGAQLSLATMKNTINNQQ
jgi:hypothetical protein